MILRWARRALSLVCLCTASTGWAQDPFADAVASFTPGTNAGFGADQLPQIVLGPPRGSGLLQGSFDVLSLGNGGDRTGACEKVGDEIIGVRS